MTDEALWGSHLPVLMAGLATSVGPVVEFGVGHFSTPCLHAVCMSVGRKLFSVEQNPEWFKMFADAFSTEDHRFLQGDYLKLIDDLPPKIGLAFIDHSPGGQSRADVFDKMIIRADYVVVHDYHYENQEFIEPLLGGLQTYISRRYQPPTLIASLKFDLPPGLSRL